MSARILVGDCTALLVAMPAESVQCCITSPPYWGLRDYGMPGQLGLEPTPEEYVARMVEVFREVRRVLRDNGTLWLNLGDSYASGGAGGASPSSTLTGGGRAYRDGSKLEAMHDGGGVARKVPAGLKPKDLVGIPWRVAFALQADGWYLRSDIIWHKPNPMPESVTDRPTKGHEYVFLLTKSARYFYDAEAVAEPSAGRERFANWTGGKVSENGDRNDGARQDMTPTERRNLRTVWTIATQPYSEAHFAVMPPALVEPCVKAGSAPGDMVLDPFSGAGTVGLVALRLGRAFIGCELNPEYAEMSRKRLVADAPLFNDVCLVTDGAPS